MLSIENTTSRAMRAVLPSYIKDCNAGYTKMAKGETRTIIYVAYSNYIAKGKDGAPIIRKDGSNLLNTTAYVLFEDGTYSTVKNDVAVGQLISETGDYPIDQLGTFEYKLDNPVKVEITTVNQKYGTKQYEVFAFIPLD